ncbi:hypothetical protein [Delftia acidovorans]
MSLIQDFERTDNTDKIHAILGRALIVATRFDSMCKQAAVHIGVKEEIVFYLANDDAARSFIVQSVADKHRTLNLRIQSLLLPKDVSALLDDARKARNIIAHELSQGLTGCLDFKINEGDLIKRVGDLVSSLAYGDIIISQVISVLNNEPQPNADFLSSYVSNVTRWVVEG